MVSVNQNHHLIAVVRMLIRLISNISCGKTMDKYQLIIKYACTMGLCDAAKQHSTVLSLTVRAMV